VTGDGVHSTVLFIDDADHATIEALDRPLLAGFPEGAGVIDSEARLTVHHGRSRRHALRA
jgi:hypothetical protein